jgi:hypothetical protein
MKSLDRRRTAIEFPSMKSQDGMVFRKRGLLVTRSLRQDIQLPPYAYRQDTLCRIAPERRETASGELFFSETRPAAILSPESFRRPCSAGLAPSAPSYMRESLSCGVHPEIIFILHNEKKESSLFVNGTTK